VKRRQNPAEAIKEHYGFVEANDEHWLTWIGDGYAWRLSLSHIQKNFDFLWGTTTVDYDVSVWVHEKYISWSGKLGVMPKLSDLQLRKLGIANTLILEQMVSRMAELR